MSGLPQALRDELLAAKAAFRDDQNDINRARKEAAGRAVSDWRNSPAAVEPAVWRPNVFRGADAEAFLPESEGGDDARALQLVAGLDGVTDADAELARTRENN